MAFSTNIRQGLPGTNTLTHYEHSYITDVKSFITFDTNSDVTVDAESMEKNTICKNMILCSTFVTPEEVNVIKLFTALSYENS